MRCTIIILLLASSFMPLQAQSVAAKVTAIVGTVEIKTPGATQFQALKLNDAVPVGSVISTTKDGEVILQGIGGSLFKVEHDSQVWVDQLTSNPANQYKPTPSSQSQYSIDRGGASYIFDQFPDEKSDHPDSYFKIKTPGGIAAARGGSGYMSSEGEFGAVSGTLDVHTITGQQIAVPAGSGGTLSLKDGISPIHAIAETPNYGTRVASVLNLANNGVTRGLINPRERISAAMYAHQAGFTPDQVNEMMSRPPHAQWNREPDMNQNWNRQDWNKPGANQGNWNKPGSNQQNGNKQNWNNLNPNKQDWNKQNWNQKKWQQNEPESKNQTRPGKKTEKAVTKKPARKKRLENQPEAFSSTPNTRSGLLKPAIGVSPRSVIVNPSPIRLRVSSEIRIGT